MSQSDRVDTMYAEDWSASLLFDYSKRKFLQRVAGCASYQKMDLTQLLLRELRHSVKILKQIILDCNHLK